MGGQELAVLLHAEGLRKRGHDIQLLLEPGSPIFEMANRQGLPVQAVRMRRLRYPLAILTFRKVLLREKPDVLHVNSSRDSWIGALAARLVRPRPKVIRTRHISTPLNRNVTTRLLYRHLQDMVIVTGGELTRLALIERDGLDPERVAAFPIGIDLGQFRPGLPDHDIRAELGLDPGCRLVGLISFLRAYKGHAYFIEAAARVLTRTDQVAFLIVGEGPLEHRLRSHIASLGVTERVLMLGFRKDLMNVFRSLDVFVIPSIDADTIPQVLVQAMAMSLPVISTTVGSIPDMVANGETGFVVPPRDAGALADRIVTLLADTGLCRAMGERGRKKVEQEYSLEHMLDRLEAVYRRVCCVEGS